MDVGAKAATGWDRTFIEWSAFASRWWLCSTFHLFMMVTDLYFSALFAKSAFRFRP